MKKIAALILIISLLCALGGCGDYVSMLPGDELPAASGAPASSTPADEDEGEKLFSFLGLSGFADNFSLNTPVAVSYGHYGEGGGFMSPVMDAAMIRAVFDAMSKIKIGGIVNTYSADNDSVYTFHMQDGTENTVRFNSGQLMDNGRAYKTTGAEELFAIAFPLYGGECSLFSLYGSEAYSSFADSFQTDPPLSVSYSRDGSAPMKTADAATISALFAALSACEPIWVDESSADMTGTHTYTFAMSDGSNVVFSFIGSCAVVDLGLVLGTRYYTLEGTEELFALQVRNDASTRPAFTPGPVSSLRTNYTEIYEISSRTGTWDVAIDGVSFDYTFGDANGYFEPVDEAAYNFCRQLTEMRATEEVAEPSKGKELSVFVSLTDGSEVSFTLMEDCIMVTGVWYRLEPADVAALYSTAASLAGVSLEGAAASPSPSPSPAA